MTLGAVLASLRAAESHAESVSRWNTSTVTVAASARTQILDGLVLCHSEKFDVKSLVMMIRTSRRRLKMSDRIASFRLFTLLNFILKLD